MTRYSRRRVRARELINRARIHLEDEDRFTTHEMVNRLSDLTSEEKRGLHSANATIDHLKDPQALASFLRGHPEIIKHPEGIEDKWIGLKNGETSIRIRSQLWTFTTESLED